MVAVRPEVEQLAELHCTLAARDLEIAELKFRVATVEVASRELSLLIDDYRKAHDMDSPYWTCPCDLCFEADSVVPI